MPDRVDGPMTRVEAGARVAATSCFFVAVAGAVLVFAVPGGNWSDVPGWILLGAGALGEAVLTLAVVLIRLSR